jgi:hypothetical protein
MKFFFFSAMGKHYYKLVFSKMYNFDLFAHNPNYFKIKILSAELKGSPG